MCDLGPTMDVAWPGARDPLPTPDPDWESGCQWDVAAARRAAQHAQLVAASRQALIALTYPTGTSREWRDSVREKLAKVLDREPRA